MLGLKSATRNQSKLPTCGGDVLTSSDSQDIDRDHEGSVGMPSLDDRRNSSDDHDHMCNTANGNANADGSETAPFCVCQPPTKYGLANSQ